MRVCHDSRVITGAHTNLDRRETRVHDSVVVTLQFEDDLALTRRKKEDGREETKKSESA